MWDHLQGKQGALADRYERLRQEVLAKEIDSPLALGVFLRQGMVGWIRVQSFFATVASPPQRRSEAAVPQPKSLAGELTRILTELLLTRKELQP